MVIPFRTGDAANMILVRRSSDATPMMEMPFKGRRIDVIGRSIRMPGNETPIKAVQDYLGEARTKSASLLAERPVIVVWPGKYLGRFIWDPQSVV